jgi:hypothetical protein
MPSCSNCAWFVRDSSVPIMERYHPEYFDDSVPYEKTHKFWKGEC